MFLSVSLTGKGAESADGGDDEDHECARRRDYGDHDEPVRAADLQQQDRLEGEHSLTHSQFLTDRRYSNTWVQLLYNPSDARLFPVVLVSRWILFWVCVFPATCGVLPGDFGYQGLN